MATVYTHKGTLESSTERIINFQVLCYLTRINRYQFIREFGDYVVIVYHKSASLLQKIINLQKLINCNLSVKIAVDEKNIGSEVEIPPGTSRDIKFSIDKENVSFNKQTNFKSYLVHYLYT